MTWTNRERSAIVKRIRARDGGKICHWCGASPRQSLDHIVARSMGGPDDDLNLVLSCVDCNSRRGNTPHPEHCAFCRTAFATFLPALESAEREST